MHCLYCSKEIGLIKALKGSEYCSAAHRKQHGQRLGKALTQMFAPEPPPAGVAGFFLKWPSFEGNSQCVLAPWQSGRTPDPIRGSRTWHFSIVSTLTQPDAVCALPSPISEVAIIEEASITAEASIPEQAAALPGSAPEPAASFVQPSVALFITLGRACSLPDLRIAAELSPSPVLDQAPLLPAAAAEPAASFVQSCVAPFVTLGLTPGQAYSLPDFRIAAELSPSPVLDQAPLLSIADAEPVATFIRQSLAQPVAAVGGSRQTAWPAFSQFAGFRSAGGFAGAPAVSGPAAEPAASFVQPSLAQPVPALAPALRIAAFRIEADLEPLTIVEEMIASTGYCEVFWPAPAAEAASSFVRTSVASAFSTAIALVAPHVPGAIAMPHVPVASTLLAPQEAEPAMAMVSPRAADSPIVLTGPAQAAAVLALTSHAAILPMALPVTGTLDAVASQPVAAESLLASASAAPISRAPDVLVPPFQLAASSLQIVLRSEGPFLTLNAAEPQPASAKVIAMQPISTLKVAKPQPDALRPLSSIPLPGLVALEYHGHRLRSAPVARVQWRNGRIALFPPRLSLRPIFEKPEAVVKLKPVRNESDLAEVFTMPGARKPANPFLRHAGWAIAASLLAGAVLWLGGGAPRDGRQMPVARTYSGAPGTRSGSGSRNGGAPAGNSESMGAVAWMRGAISNRATVEAADNFRGGMESWGSQPKTYAAGWSRHAEGYVSPGKLAIFNPSRQFKDYRLEFFGQIESKSVGWVVRAQDPKNYYAMKFTVVESGLRTVIALAHYPVVNGKTGHKVETPLNVMVHRNRPFQVAVNVKGNRFVTSVDGAEVDSWTDNTLASGGIGFFSEAGEKARIYWMKVSKNDDWLGRVCALFSGGSDTEATAELWGPGYPGGAPTPSAPTDHDGVTMAAACMGLPYFRASQTKARVSNYWKRDEPWNS